MSMLILASGSPRRRELLEYLRSDFAVVALPTDESMPDGMSPRQATEVIALRKARAVSALHPRDTVIGADTVVVLDNTVFGKPSDREDAARMLRALSGREHYVFTGVAVLAPGVEHVFSEATAVRFAPLSEGEIESYVESGEPMDKAGAYGIQGKGALLVEGITGDFYNVMGLPLRRLGSVLAEIRK